MSAHFDSLRDALRGNLVLPGDPDYDDARAVYNAMIDKRPAAIAECKDAADVIACVNFARENDHLLSIRGGGHNAGGLGVADGALVADLGGIRYVQVDPQARTARVGGGCVWADVDHATHAFGLACPTGIISSTGVGGLALGGGIGHLTRACGLTVDNILEVEMVLADGSFVKANADQNEDLYWAVRGGGGNFGAVTSFLFRLHEVKNVIAGPTFWKLEDSERILKWYSDFILNAPRELNGFFAYLDVPPAPPFPEELHGVRVCGVVWCYVGDHGSFDEIFAPVRETHPIMDGTSEVPLPALNSVFDPLYPKGHQWYWKADFIDRINDESVRAHHKYGSQLPSPLSSMHLYPIDGAVHDVDASDTAFWFRRSNWAQVIVGVHHDNSRNSQLINWARDYYDAIHPHGAGGAYVNFLMEDDANERIRETYQDNYDKLAAIKAKYDPNNFFRVNQNIRPAA